MRERALEHDASLLVLVEAQVQEGAHAAAALRAPLEDRERAGAVRRVIAVVLAVVVPIALLRLEEERVRGAGVILPRVLEK